MKSWGSRRGGSQIEIVLGLLVVAAVGAFLATAGDMHIRRSGAQEGPARSDAIAGQLRDEVVVNQPAAVDETAETSELRRAHAGPGDAGAPMRITRTPRGEPGATVAAANAAFRGVCCLRADNSAYWSAAAVCDDLGAAVDDRLCARDTSDVCCESPVAGRATETQMSWVTADDCRQQFGKQRSAERCSPMLANVCCEVQGIVATTTRRECRGIANHREVPTSQCEPVCCHRASSRSVQWESRGNCDGDAGEAGFVVASESCVEVCCQHRDRSYKREDRRSCVTQGGTVRAISECGSTIAVEVEEPKTDPESTAPTNDVSEVDPGRPPQASPYQ